MRKNANNLIVRFENMKSTDEQLILTLALKDEIIPFSKNNEQYSYTFQSAKKSSLNNFLYALTKHHLHISSISF